MPQTPLKPWTRSRGMTASAGVLIVGLITALTSLAHYFGLKIDVDQGFLDTLQIVGDAALPVALAWLGRRGWIGRRDAEAVIEGSPLHEELAQKQVDALQAKLPALREGRRRSAKTTAAGMGLVLAMSLPLLAHVGCGSSQAFAVQTSVSFETPKAGHVAVSVGVDLAGVSHVEVQLERVGDLGRFAGVVAQALGAPVPTGAAQSIEVHLPDGTRALVAISLSPPTIRIEAENPRWARAVLAGLDHEGLNLQDASPLPEEAAPPEAPAPESPPDEPESPEAAPPSPTRLLGRPQPVSCYGPGRSPATRRSRG